jgi:hypothetical protein
MRRFIHRTLLAAVTLAVLAGLNGWAQLATDQLRAHVPFRFYAGDTLLPAGTYTLRVPDRAEPDWLVLESADSRLAVHLDSQDAAAESTPTEAYLVFHRFGDKAFLSEVWIDGRVLGYVIPASHTQLEAEKSQTHMESKQVWARHLTPAGQ